MTINREFEGREAQLDHKVSVMNETDSLKDLVIWGEPGCETVLGQLVNTGASLFYSNFDVIKAREEFSGMVKTFEEKGINVIRFKDIYVNEILSKEDDFVDLPKTADDLIEKLNEKGRFYTTKTDNQLLMDSPEDKEKKKVRRFDEPDEFNKTAKNWIKQIVEEDVVKYGEENAIKLNWTLSFHKGKPHEIQLLPMSNFFYSRDQSNAVTDRIILSNMRWPIRKPEVAIYEQIYKHLGYGDNLVKTTEGTIEGGDTIVMGDTCFIGVGGRTSMGAVLEISRKMGDSLEKHGKELIVVINKELATKNIKKAGEELTAMHLDTFWMPINEKVVLASDKEVSKRRVRKVYKENGNIKWKDLGPFKDYLDNKGIEIAPISPAEQENYATNFLHLGNGFVVVPVENKEAIAHLEKYIPKEKIIKANIYALIGGYGAVHCMTAALRRE